MKIWVDDVRPAPNDTYVVVKSVNECIDKICACEDIGVAIDMLDLDHDAGNYFGDGGDYIRILDWLEETGRSFPIRVHSMNPVGRGNMRAIIRKNGWSEIL